MTSAILQYIFSKSVDHDGKLRGASSGPPMFAIIVAKIVIPANLSPQFCICANLPESLALQIWVGTFQPKTYYNPFLVYCRELAPRTVSLTRGRAQGDDSKHDSHYTLQHEFASYPLRKSHSHTGRSCICVLYSKEAIIICTMFNKYMFNMFICLII